MDSVDCIQLIVLRDHTAFRHLNPLYLILSLLDQQPFICFILAALDPQPTSAEQEQAEQEGGS